MDNAYKAGFDDLFFRNESITVAEIGEIVKENVWRRNETFYFVNFPSDSDGGYPCITSRDSIDPNKPCSFPFYWKDELLFNCTDQDNGGELWCYTKLAQDFRPHPNNTAKWGLCGDQCQGTDQPS